MTRILCVRSWLFAGRRNYCVPSKPSSKPSPDSQSPPPAAAPGPSMSHRYRPTELQKTILVWTKKFKSKAEIPDFVSAELIERSRSEARIKISNRLMILTALASFGAILIGKSAAKRGESIHQMNLDWHKKYQEEHDQKEAAKQNKV